MTYKHKESIKDAVNEVYSASFADELNRKNEIDEVYRKAEAFDEIRADSKMDIYDFELGEYVLKTIKEYESEAE